ncbi:MAG: tail fiber protein, partial [Candidatus ainarchaeum sp.]|nr:tail fiber protein [Candidatus ainarchaeum sp.]
MLDNIDLEKREALKKNIIRAGLVGVGVLGASSFVGSSSIFWRDETGKLTDLKATSGEVDLTPYWKSDGSSTVTGNWDLGSYDLTTTGKVGIGVYPVVEKLEVNGNIKADEIDVGKIRNLTDNGFVKTSNSDGTLGVENVSIGSPTGSITMFAGSSAPTDWLICDGSAISRTTYSDLFNIIGEIYGVGDGSTTFNIPDLRGVVPVGKTETGTFNALNNTGGSETHTLTTSEMPSHTHVQEAHGHTQNAHTHTQNAHGHTNSVGTQSANHTHSATTGNPSANHSHEVSITSGTVSSWHTHTTNSAGAHSHSPASGGQFVAYTGGGSAIPGGPGTPLILTASTNSAGAHTHTTGNPSANHSHSVSGNTGTV